MRVNENGEGSLGWYRRRLLGFSERRVPVYAIAERLFILGDEIQAKRRLLTDANEDELLWLTSQENKSPEYIKALLDRRQNKLLKIADAVAPAVIEYMLNNPQEDQNTEEL